MADPSSTAPSSTASAAKASAQGGMVVVYDGECPFCSNYVRLMALRRLTGSVELVDARSGDPRVADLWAKGYDLNEGMAAIYGGTVYYGSDALALISGIVGDGGIARRALSLLLRDPGRARLLYPAMKTGRRLALRALGRKDLTPSFD